MNYISYVNVRRAGASMPMRPRATPAVHACLLAVGVPAAALCMRVPASIRAFSAGQEQDPGSGPNYWPADTSGNTWFLRGVTSCLLFTD